MKKEKETVTEQVLSTKHPEEKEIFRNFYPPMGNYRWITQGLGVFTAKGGRWWLNYFVRKRLQFTKEMNVQRCEDLIKDGRLVQILNQYCGLDERIKDIVVNQLQKNGVRLGVIFENGYWRFYVGCLDQFKDPDFVRSLKPEFAELEKDYERSKESDIWLLFEIVKNL